MIIRFASFRCWESGFSQDEKKRPTKDAAFLRWSGQRDSNPRPSGPKPDALPDCAMPRS